MNEEMELPENAMPEQPIAEVSVVDNVEVVETPAMIAETVEAVQEETASPVIEAVAETVETVQEEIVSPAIEVVAETVETVEEIVAESTVNVDYSNYSKADFVAILHEQLALVKAENAQSSAFKKADSTLKEIKPFFDQHRNAERAVALQDYVAANESEDGFDYKQDATSQEFDSLYKQIKEAKNVFFKDVEKSKEKNFSLKTDLLKRLRDLVEKAENSPTADKASVEELKKIQEEWKGAGNVTSANNNALWDAFHALTDRFYSNRSIYYELLDLDRKKNLSAKIEVCTRVEKLVAEVQNTVVTGDMLDRANAMFEEFRGIGPATRETQEALWQRFKEALDVIYAKRREQLEVQKAEAEENYKLKAEIAEMVVPFASFQSSMITDWNERTKALMALQEQWNNQKGSMPREKGKTLADAFWGNVKTFYKKKSDFFVQLEAQRAENLQAKVNLCEEVENLVTAGDNSAEATNRVIQLQKDWKNIGFVPEKQKESIYVRFKKACDDFFDLKRLKNAETDLAYEANLAKKTALCDQIDAETKAGNADIDKLNAYKTEFNAIGFVPRKNMQDIQKRFNSTINAYISGMGKVSSAEKEKIRLESEVSAMRSEGTTGGKGLQLRETDIQKKIQALEGDIALWGNNIEFFAKSKTTEKLRADFEKKIEKAENEVKALKQQLKIVKG